MALPAPVLDDRSWEQLSEELRRRIQVYAPEWTDHGPSDPGITLLELFAHLGENLLFRFNQIPDQTMLWLLRLLQLPPRPPRSATGLVAFTQKPPDQATAPAVAVATTVLAGAVPFRVANDVCVLPVTTTAAIKASAIVSDGSVLEAEYNLALDAADLDDDQEAKPYVVEALAADPSAPDFLPLDVTRAIDQCLWIAVHPAPDTSPATIAKLLSPAGPLGEELLVLGVQRDEQFPTIDEVDPCDGLFDTPERERVEAAAIAATLATCAVDGPEPPGGGPVALDSTLHWQVSTTVANADGTPDYVAVNVEMDTSEGLERDGVVGLRIPTPALTRIGLAPLDDPDLAGVGGRPPVLDPAREVLFWLRAFPREGVSEIGKVRWLGANAAQVTQVVDAAPEFLGFGSGVAGQELVLANAPLVPGSLVVEVEEQGQWNRWDVVDTFAGSTRGDAHVVLDVDANAVRCGDSVRGRTFGIGDRVRARAYRYGGGQVGNVGPKAISTVQDQGGVQVENPWRTTGGEDAEPITEALRRIPGEFSRHDRAVTADDFRELATIAGVGRSECLPRFDPATRTDPATKGRDAAGVVTVVVWPREDPLHPDAPVPDASLLRAVCRQLDARRLITTELNVIPPTYRKVAVSVGLQVEPGYSSVGVRRWVDLVLRQYLAPLPPYGPAGQGWPLGHRVHGPELEAAVLQVDGVDFIEDLLVADVSGPAAVAGTVELDEWEVPTLAELTVVVGPPPPAGDPVDPPDDTPTPVPIPVPRDEC